jgi:hypothetical protein
LIRKRGHFKEERQREIENEARKKKEQRNGDVKSFTTAASCS